MKQFDNSAMKQFGDEMFRDNINFFKKVIVELPN
jgi:hypothetical protein